MECTDSSCHFHRLPLLLFFLSFLLNFFPLTIYLLLVGCDLAIILALAFSLWDLPSGTFLSPFLFLSPFCLIFYIIFCFFASMTLLWLRGSSPLSSSAPCLALKYLTIFLLSLLFLAASTVFVFSTSPVFYSFKWVFFIHFL